MALQIMTVVYLQDEDRWEDEEETHIIGSPISIIHVKVSKHGAFITSTETTRLSRDGLCAPRFIVLTKRQD